MFILYTLVFLAMCARLHCLNVLFSRVSDPFHLQMYVATFDYYLYYVFIAISVFRRAENSLDVSAPLFPPRLVSFGDGFGVK
jgi:hypothetical protein